MYHVEIGGPVHLYAREVPAGAMAVGVIRTDDGVAGALVRFRNGAYAQMNDLAIRALDRLEVLRHVDGSARYIEVAHDTLDGHARA